MKKSQTIISIRRDKVKDLRALNRSNHDFLKSLLQVHKTSNYNAYLSDAIFIGHSEFESINACHMITPFLGASLSHLFQKAFHFDKDDNVIFYEKTKIIENLIRGYKGVLDVEHPEKLEIQSDFANHKNSVYSVFGFFDEEIINLTARDFEKMLDLTDFVDKDANKDAEINSQIMHGVNYLGSFAQRQVCLAYQSDGIFKAYPFKSNKTIHLDVEDIVKRFKDEAVKVNTRFQFANESKKEFLFFNHVSSVSFREDLSCDLYEAFINGLKGSTVRVLTDKELKAEEERLESEADNDDNDDDDY